MITLRPARPEEAPALSELCMISKAYWGYDAAFMNSCRAELTITAADFENAQIQVAVDGGKLAGMAQLMIEGASAELDKLYIHPDFIGAGIGGALFAWAVRQASDAGANVMTIDADPDAAAFYRRMGAVDNGASPSGSIPGRMLPHMRFDLLA